MARPVMDFDADDLDPPDILDLDDPDLLAAVAPGLIDDVDWLLALAEHLTGVDRTFFEPPQPGDTLH